MHIYHATARLTGLLFIIATFTFILGNGLIESVISTSTYLADAYINKPQIIAGVLLELVNSIAVIGIAVILFPVLKRHNEVIALGYVSFRVIEAVILIIGSFSPLLLLPLSQEYMQAGLNSASYFQVLGTLFVDWYHISFNIAMLILSIYSLAFCHLLYQSKLIPQTISIFGLIGYASLLISALLEVFGYNTEGILYIPGALFELIFPIWLIIKGFNEEHS